LTYRDYLDLKNTYWEKQVGCVNAWNNTNKDRVALIVDIMKK